MRVPVYKGRKINKILCLFFLVPTLILLLAAAVSALTGRADTGYALCITALITGAFSLLYGILWFLYGRKEKETELALNDLLGRQYAPEDPARPEYREFLLPKTRLTETARERLRSIVRWFLIVPFGVFLLIGGIQFAAGVAVTPLQLLYVLLFSFLITIPGMLMQLGLYREYVRSVPSRILLFPGKLIVDDRSFPAGTIREVRVSPERIYNRNSPGVFREMQIRTENGGEKFRIDYRSGSASNGAPFWEEYEAFIAALSGWGAENGVPVVIAYMD